jgi:hypothetical protein
MTVGDLRAILEGMPKDMLVLLPSKSGALYPAQMATVCFIRPHTSRQAYVGTIALAGQYGGRRGLVIDR